MEDKQKSLYEMMSPYVMAANLIMARAAGDAAKFHDRLRKAKEVLLGPLETEVAVTPYDVVWREDRVKLKHYHARSAPLLKTPLFIVYAQVNRETMLDLQPGRSVVETFLNAGLDIYMLDWGYPTRKDRFLNLDDHVNGYIYNAVEFILKEHGLDKLNIMAICQGGTMCVMYAALHPEKVKTWF